MVCGYISGQVLKLSWASSVYESLFSWLIDFFFPIHRKDFALNVVGVMPDELLWISSSIGMILCFMVTMTIDRGWVPVVKMR